MDAEPSSRVPEEWLAHAAWLHALARSLVDESSAADDLVQEAWMARRRRGPRAGQPLRPWLVRVVQNLARQRFRSETSRAQRERSIDAGEPWPSAADLAERLESQRLLVEALQRLDEPLREAIVLRYFEGKTSAEIARAKSLPSSTVRWRVMRGLELLREDLDRRNGGDRRAWIAFLAPLTGRSTSRTLPIDATSVGVGSGILGGLFVKTAVPLVIAAALVLLVALALFAVREESPRVAEAQSTKSEQTLGLHDVVPATSDGPGSEATRSAIASTGSTDSAAVSTSPRLTARIVDVNHRGIANARLRVLAREDAGVASSDASGRCELDLKIDPRAGSTAEGTWTELEVTAPNFATSTFGVHAKPEPTLPLGEIVLTTAGSIVGRVVDETGQAIVGADVLVQLLDSTTNVRRSIDEQPFRVAQMIDAPLTDAMVLPFIHAGVPHTRTGADGSFVIEDVPCAYLHVLAATPGLGAAILGGSVLPSGPTRWPDLKLLPLDPTRMVSGVVLSPNGAPMRRARVHGQSMGPGTAVCDESGRFEFVFPGSSAAIDFEAEDPDGQFAPAIARRVPTGTANLRLRLSEWEQFTLRVQDPDGNPVEEYEIAVIVAGRMTELGHSLCHEVGGQCQVRMPVQPFFLRVVAPGFAFKRTETFRPENCAAGAVIDVTLETTAPITGRVQALGQPIARAQVTVLPMFKESQLRNLAMLEASPAPLQSRVFWLASADRAVSDAQGRFAIATSGFQRHALRVEADGFAPAIVWGVMNRTQDLVVDLTTGGAIEGTVRSRDGRDPCGILLGATCGDERIVYTRTDEHGRYRFERLTPGPWQVRVLVREATPDDSEYGETVVGRAGTSFEADCEVQQGSTTRFDIDAAALAFARLEGRVKMSGVQFTHSIIHLLRFPGTTQFSSNAAHLRSDGGFELPTVARGRYCLTLRGDPDQRPYLDIDDEIDLREEHERWDVEVSSGRIAGRITRALGPNKHWVHAWSGAGHLMVYTHLETDAAGVLVPTIIPAGIGRIVEFQSGGVLPIDATLPSIASVDVAIGGTYELDLH